MVQKTLVNYAVMQLAGQVNYEHHQTLAKIHYLGRVRRYDLKINSKTVCSDRDAMLDRDTHALQMGLLVVKTSDNMSKCQQGQYFFPYGWHAFPVKVLILW